MSKSSKFQCSSITLTSLVGLLGGLLVIYLSWHSAFLLSKASLTFVLSALLILPSLWFLKTNCVVHPLCFVCLLSFLFLTFLPIVDLLVGDGGKLLLISQKALLIHLLGFFLFFLSYLLTRSHAYRLANFLYPTWARSAKIQISRLKLMTIFYLLIASIGFFIYISHAGGLLNMFMNLTSRIEVTAGYGIPKTMTYVLVSPLYVLFYVLVFHKMDHLRESTGGVLILFLFTTLFTAIVYSALGGRERIIFAFLGLYAIKVKMTGETGLKRVSISSIFLFFSLFIFMYVYKMFRENPHDFYYIIFSFRSPRDFFLDAVYKSGFHFLIPNSVIIENVPNSVPFQYGVTYLNSFLNFIPRWLWPDKPSGASTTFFQEYWFRHKSIVGLPKVTGFTEAYFNFSIIGVIAFSICAGFFARVISYFRDLSTYNPFVVTFYFIGIQALMGFLLSDFTVFITSMLPIVIGHYVFLRIVLK